VGVTGTNGKSTAATLIAEIVQVSGRPAVACGNLGTPFSSVIPALTPATVAVVEISSFQLLWCHALRPKIAVFLNFGTNHLDRHADPQAYLAAKARLFQRQTPDDWAVLNGTDPRLVELSGRLQARCVWFGENRTNPVAYRLAAETRRALTENAQAVLQVARLLGVADPLAWQVIRAFRGLEHRLEDVATVRGVRFVNDSKSTTPESLVYALSQVRGRVVVILGGRDKGMDFTPLKARLAESRVAGVVLIGESRSRLRALANGSEAVRECGTLEEAVGAAAGFAGPGTTVLFSPACASFDMFQNFEERGSAFKAAVARLLR
jgi:UDP-N-acetylmuramoylalanine--D-glutamate ligase